MHSSIIQRFFDWLFIRFSRSTRFDGLWVGVFNGDHDKEILRRVSDALQLIKTYDPYRYRRVLKEIGYLWVSLLPGAAAVFEIRLRRCVMDPPIVLSYSPERLASVIVHEATHGRLIRHNIGYPQELRRRVERVCMRQELAFAQKIPDGEALRPGIEHRLTLAPDFWTDEASKDRRREGLFAAAHHAGMPEWLVEALLSFRKKIAGDH
jgi:hypothetical protein